MELEQGVTKSEGRRRMLMATLLSQPQPVSETRLRELSGVTGAFFSHAMVGLLRYGLVRVRRVSTPQGPRLFWFSVGSEPVPGTFEQSIVEDPTMPEIGEVCSCGDRRAVGTVIDGVEHGVAHCRVIDGDSE